MTTEQPFRESLHPVTLNIGQASVDFSDPTEPHRPPVAAKR
ncbi:hypothetical protein ACFQH5_14675 [Halomonas salifodinae]|uniref:Uncharacterized protein n=1 Tax=Halomonas salifodinae TaxID=438745 RepID=A0ABW2F152_9GAMM